MKISAIVLIGGRIDKNLLRKCLKSLDWCDEIVKIKTKNLEGSFSDWRNEGTRQAKGDWFFYVDVDEQVPQNLKEEILQITNHKSQITNAYAIPRKNIIFGKEMKHCGLWPDFVVRLIKIDNLIKWEGKLHEQPKVNGEIRYLKEPLIHYKHDNLSDMVDKTNKWSEVEAKLMYQANHPPMNIFRFFTAGLREFYLRMIRQTAFLDGPEGIIYGMYQVFSRLISYSKLWELQLKNARSNL